MSFTELSDGSGVANYVVTAVPPLPAEYLTVTATLTSGWATGEVDPAVAEQIFSDLKGALEPLGYTVSFSRVRTANDSWAEDPA